MKRDVTTPPSMGTLLRRARVSAGLTRYLFARMLAASPASVTRWERDKMRPGFEYRQQMLEILRRAQPDALRALAVAFGLQAALPAPAAQAARPTDAMNAALFAAAEDLDVAPRRLRAAVVAILREADRLGVSPREAIAALAPPGKPAAGRPAT